MKDKKILELSPVPAGFDLYVNDVICITSKRVQFRFPKSRKKRIRNKWKKKNENYKLIENHRAVRIGMKMFVSQKVFDLLINSSTNYKETK